MSHQEHNNRHYNRELGEGNGRLSPSESSGEGGTRITRRALDLTRHGLSLDELHSLRARTTRGTEIEPLQQPIPQKLRFLSQQECYSVLTHWGSQAIQGQELTSLTGRSVTNANRSEAPLGNQKALEQTSTSTLGSLPEVSSVRTDTESAKFRSANLTRDEVASINTNTINKGKITILALKRYIEKKPAKSPDDIARLQDFEKIDKDLESMKTYLEFKKKKESWNTWESLNNRAYTNRTLRTALESIVKANKHLENSRTNRA